jgi:S1-C subfamily serine protease
MSARLTNDRPCGACGAANPASARFCHACGRTISAAPAAVLAAPPAAQPESTTPPPARAGTRGHRPFGQWVALAVAALAVVAASATFITQRNQQADIQAALARIDEQAAGAQQQYERLQALEEVQQEISGEFKRQTQGTKLLASRVLPSVFTIETPFGNGSGFAAWRKGGDTMVITANHVVAGVDEVTLRRKGASWQGDVVETDSTNDLAVIRVAGAIAKPLWRQPTTALPKVGDTLVLFGSPLGYEGTVSKGIVSRISYREVQTDAPANPGNSGGPALSESGGVVGVVVSGYEGRDISFAIPMRRVCVALRAC